MKTILLHMRLILKTSPGLHLLIEYNYIMTIWMLYVKEEEVAYKLLLTGQMNYVYAYTPLEMIPRKLKFHLLYNNSL